MRKLASIRQISEIQPIEGADLIVRVKVDDWYCVALKSEFSVGDLCVYFEIDSFIPIIPQVEHLRARAYKKMLDKEGVRIKTIRLKGQISQGLVLPVRLFFDMFAGSKFDEGQELSEYFFIGNDVSDLIGVEKYEQPIPAELSGKVTGNFPVFIKKTDQERCLSGDTVVDTEHGKIRIQDICEQKLNINVWTYNHITEELELKPITAHSILTRSRDWYKITLKSGKTITCTGNHMIWCNDIEAYRRVDEMLCGQIFITKTV
jgi:hypothetical protein